LAAHEIEQWEGSRVEAMIYTTVVVTVGFSTLSRFIDPAAEQCSQFFMANATGTKIKCFAAIDIKDSRNVGDV
jgi:hypothetical protein